MNRPSKKIFFAKPRGQDEKKELLAEYLQIMHEREVERNKKREDEINEQKAYVNNYEKDVQKQIKEEDDEKQKKISKMRKYINEVKAERKQVIDDEQQYMYGQKPVTYFPYTHGDSLEMARRKIY